MSKKLRRSLLVFLGIIGVALVAVKILHFFFDAAAWLYIPAVIIGITAGVIEYRKC